MVWRVPAPALLPQLDAIAKRWPHRVERDLLDKKQSLIGPARPVYHEIDLPEEAAVILKIAPIFGCIGGGRFVLRLAEALPVDRQRWGTTSSVPDLAEHPCRKSMAPVKKKVEKLSMCCCTRFQYQCTNAEETFSCMHSLLCFCLARTCLLIHLAIGFG